MHQKAAMSVDAQAREANACAQTLPLAEGLHPEQHYVAEACRVLGIEAVACRHAAATSTCAEKAQLLGWPPHRIVKALYFRDRGCYIGVVLPELSRRLDVAALLAAVQPAQSKSLYFVSRGDGTSQFSSSLDDHNRAVNRYQRGGGSPQPKATQ